jgi:hypothetical protein
VAIVKEQDGEYDKHKSFEGKELLVLLEKFSTKEK